MTHQPEHDPLGDLAASGADVDTARRDDRRCPRGL
jgi:hypothetical protein